ncbi:MAG: hypothetical protein EA340_01205 [Nitriliruptor sp.]|nr:MAG: hypothetical protein EA340_01205 [Nitriliruptor sp.]
MAAPDHLPPEATDEGERIVLAPDRTTRLWAVGGAVLAFTIGVLLLVSGDGTTMVVAGIAAAIAGIYLLVVQAQRLEFDAGSARRRSLLRPVTVAWSDITEAKVTTRYERTPVAGSSRRLGGLNLSMGVGGRRGRGLRRDQRITVLELEHRASGPKLTMELNRSDIARGEALLAALNDRGWLPDDVPVTADADR